MTDSIWTGAFWKATAERHRIPAALIAALIKQESRWDPRAVSKSSAKGLAHAHPRAETQNYVRIIMADPGVAALNGKA